MFDVYLRRFLFLICVVFCIYQMVLLGCWYNIDEMSNTISMRWWSGVGNTLSLIPIALDRSRKIVWNKKEKRKIISNGHLHSKVLIFQIFNNGLKTFDALWVIIYMSICYLLDISWKNYKNKKRINFNR